MGQVRVMEKSVMLTQGELMVPCKISAPEDGRLQRIVLGVHGFGGSANDVIQSGLAEERALFDSVTFRFDFPAHGESPMTDRDFSLKNCVGTLLEVTRFAREQYPQLEDLCVFATGFGAYVTLVALEQLLALPEPPTALFVTNFEMTLGVMLALREAGIRIPEDLSVMGFDKMDLFGEIFPDLTLVRQPQDAIGLQTARLMLELLSPSGKTAPGTITLSAQLHRGKSTRELQNP